MGVFPFQMPCIDVHADGFITIRLRVTQAQRL